MAAPDSCTTLNLSGKFVMVNTSYRLLQSQSEELLLFTQNKTLSDSSDRILELQGVGWLKRSAIAIATITLHVNHFKDDEGVEHIDIAQTLTGGIPGTSENRTLDWVERHKEDSIFGYVGTNKGTRSGEAC
jgi:hypothetical protein